jgi:putative hemolysin
MTEKHNAREINALIIGLCIGFLLVNSVHAVDVVAAASKQGTILSSSGPDCAHCVSNGYVCKKLPELNDNEPICQFPDGRWCDAHEFFIGNCSSSGTFLNPFGFYNNPQGALDIADAAKTCNHYGGGVEMVHTPYGDSNICIFPNGQAIDLPQLNRLTSLPQREQQQAIWNMEAYNFLNSP